MVSSKAVTALLMLFNVYGVNAFAPSATFKTGFGQLGRTHSQMTRFAWESLASDLFGVQTFTSNMESAFNSVDIAQAAIDDDQTRAELHFDSESFPEGQQRLVSLINQVVSAIKANNAPQARGLLGSALHSVQDFYSHSNWIELGNRLPYADLGMEGLDISRLSPNTATCVDCSFNLLSATCNDCSHNVISTGLTSGYYGGNNRPKPNVRKCSHGGVLDRHAPVDTGFLGLQQWTFDGINKDVRDCSFAPHSALHEVAAGVAEAGTVQFLQILKRKLSADELKLLWGVDPSVSILNSNPSKRRALESDFVDSKIVSRGLTHDVQKITVNGRHIRARVVNAQEHFSRALRRRDESPDSLPDLYHSVTMIDRGSSLFVYADKSTDITSVDAHHVGVISIYRDVSVNIFLFGETSPYNVDQDVTFLCGRTGGQVFLLQESETSVADQIVELLSVDGTVDVLRISNSTGGTHSFPIDSSLANVTISVSGSTQALLFRPDGSQVINSSSDVETISYSTGVFFRIFNPAVGSWKIQAPATINFSVSISVSGVSSLQMEFDFVELSGRPGHLGDRVRRSYPPSNDSAIMSAYISENSTSRPIFSTRSALGNVLKSFSLLQGNSTDGYGLDKTEFYNEPNLNNRSIILGEQPFFVYVNGNRSTDKSAYQRLQAREYDPTQIGIFPPPTNTIHPGSTRNLTFLAENFADAAESLNITILSGKDILVAGPNQTAIAGGFTQSLEIAGNARRELTAYVKIPANASLSDTDIVTVYVQGRNNTDMSNFSIVSLWIVDGDPLDDAWNWEGVGSGNVTAQY